MFTHTDSVTFTEEILNEKLHFLCSVKGKTSIQNIKENQINSKLSQILINQKN